MLLAVMNNRQSHKYKTMARKVLCEPDDELVTMNCVT